MPHNRFFSDQCTNSTFSITDAEFHHLAHVMRIKKNEQIEVIDGKGNLTIGKVTQIDRSKAEVEKISHTYYEKPSFHLTLAIASPKISHLELVLEKATEIGVDQFIVFESQFSEKLPNSPSQKKRMENVLISAIKQCGRYHLPKISFFETSNDFLSLKTTSYLCHLGHPISYFSEVKEMDQDLVVIVGPEKGFSSTDLSFFLNEVQAKPICLAPFVLRMETACIAAASLFIQRFNWFSSQ